MNEGICAHQGLHWRHEILANQIVPVDDKVATIVWTCLRPEEACSMPQSAVRYKACQLHNRNPFHATQLSSLAVGIAATVITSIILSRVCGPAAAHADWVEDAGSRMSAACLLSLLMNMNPCHTANCRTISCPRSPILPLLFPPQSSFCHGWEHPRIGWQK